MVNHKKLLETHTDEMLKNLSFDWTRAAIGKSQPPGNRQRGIRYDLQSKQEGVVLFKIV